MFVAGSYSFLKEKLLELANKLPVSSKLTFIVHNNQLAVYLKEFLAEKKGIIANWEFFTPIDISKRLTGIEPLQDFEKETVIRKILYSKKYYLDSLPSDYSLIVQIIKEHYLNLSGFDRFTRSILAEYSRFLNENGYADREDVHRRLINGSPDGRLGQCIIFGITYTPPLYQDLFKKLKSLSDKLHVFVPITPEYGIFKNHNGMKVSLNFLKQLADGEEFVAKAEDPAVEVAKKIYLFRYDPERIKSKRLRFYKCLNEYEEISFVAERIVQFVRRLKIPFYRIGVVITDKETYLPVIKDVFNRYKIPYYLLEENRYITQPEFADLFKLFTLKESGFSREKVLSVLSGKLLNITGVNGLEREIIKLPPLHGLQDWKRFLFKNGRFGEMEKLLELLDLPDEGELAVYGEKVEKIIPFISNGEVAQFLKETAETLKTKTLFQKLFPKISYKEFLGLLKSFFLKEIPSQKKRENRVKILTPSSAEGNNLKLIFFTGLNGGQYPSVIRDDLPAYSDELDRVNYPEQLVMQEIIDFCGIFDGKGKIYFTFAEEGLLSGKKSPSTLIGELERITGKSFKKASLHPERFIPKEFYLKNARQIWQIDKNLNNKKTKWEMEESKKDFNYQFVQINFPISPTSFSDYAVCPYRYFFTGIIKVDREVVWTRETVPADLLGTEIHQILYQTYRTLAKNGYSLDGNITELIEKKFREKVYPLLEDVLPFYRAYEKFKLKQIEKNLINFIRWDVERLKRENMEVATEYLEKTLQDETFKGKIDRADRDGNGNYHIYDYKTGKTDRELKEKNLLTKYVQLLIYAKLLQDEGKKVVSLGIFPIKDSPVPYRFNDTKRLEELITQVYDRVKELKEKFFYPTKSQTCQRCEFKPFCPVERLEREV